MLRTFLALLFLRCLTASLIPGITPTDFVADTLISFEKEDSIFSGTNGIPLMLSEQPLCDLPAGSVEGVWHLASRTGSTYRMSWLVPADCTLLPCIVGEDTLAPSVNLTKENYVTLSALIQNNYHLQYSLDELPAAYFSGNHTVMGLPIGQSSNSLDGTFMLFNHYHFKLHYNRVSSTVTRLLFIEVVPQSIDWDALLDSLRLNYTGATTDSPKTLSRQFTSDVCGLSRGAADLREKYPEADVRSLVLNPLKSEPRVVHYSYDVEYISRDDVVWSQRWSLYTHSSDEMLWMHWVSFLLTLFITALLSVITGLSICAILNRDIKRYQKMVDQEDRGWRLVSRDVFRPPRNRLLLSSQVVFGVELWAILLSAGLGLLSCYICGGGDAGEFLFLTILILGITLAVFNGGRAMSVLDRKTAVVNGRAGVGPLTLRGWLDWIPLRIRVRLGIASKAALVSGAAGAPQVDVEAGNSVEATTLAPSAPSSATARLPTVQIADAMQDEEERELEVVESSLPAAVRLPPTGSADIPPAIMSPGAAGTPLVLSDHPLQGRDWMEHEQRIRARASAAFKHSLRNTALVIVFMPGVILGVLFVMNMVMWAVHSSAAMPFENIVMVFFLWSVAFFGTFLGETWLKQRRRPSQTQEEQTRSTPPPAHPSRRCIHLPLLYSLLAGIVPFGVIFVEYHFLLDSIWLGQPFSFVGFSVVMLCFLVVVSAEVGIVIAYMLLGREDWRWWWPSFMGPASMGIYMYLFSVLQLVTRIRYNTFVSVLLYLGYTALLALVLSLMCGAIGFLAAYRVVRHIYSAVKVD
ncbi:putative Transmembrane 9 superfamily member 4 [Paratrimastix pyriformis]|uniref:Transmembrane 9 superfamily member n=1 Tax=Paratrimastix pyriformis TaxID=342808 RepID=A0ABQ8U9B9_9EUKA|nr:putative Transmembrane 9 superfamily member 4 [Paratrimastix pyriformis]